MTAAKKPTLLARLFGRSAEPSPVVASLYTHALGRPLLIHPSMGEALIGAYLSGAVAGPGDTEEYIEPAPLEQDIDAVRKIAVLNVNGGLCARPMPGPCDDGPLSYEALGQAIDRLAADETIGAIVLRIDSPGGMASNLFDLTDRIFAARASKPVWAVVDDMAYSAAYAIASACERVWVSRTGGVGSVGVVAYHVDVSQADIKAGVKVTPIYSGAHKVDFSPHAPLSDDAKAREQAAVDQLYALFCSSVATYRGLTPEAVQATEALTFQGQAGIDVGFATDLGTFADALAALTAPDTAAAPPPVDENQGNDGGDGGNEVPEDGSTAHEEVIKLSLQVTGGEELAALTSAIAALDVPTEKRAELSAIVAGLAASVQVVDKALTVETLPAAITAAAADLNFSMTKDLHDAVAECLTSELAAGKLPNVTDVLTSARSMSQVCSLAGKADRAPAFVKSKTSVEDARKKLLEERAEEDEKIVITPAIDPKTLTAEPRQVVVSSTDIYRQRREAMTGATKPKN